MYSVDELDLPEFEELNYKIAIAADDVLEYKTPHIPREVNAHIIYVRNPVKWMAVLPRSYPVNFRDIISEVSIYLSEEGGGLIATNDYVKFSTAPNLIVRRAAALISLKEIQNPLIVYASEGRSRPCFILDLTHPRYLCFKAYPRRRWKKVEQVEVDHFYEILSHIVTSDGRTSFEVRMKL
jgi:hypothetical protein